MSKKQTTKRNEEKNNTDSYRRTYTKNVTTAFVHKQRRIIKEKETETDKTN